LGRQEDVQQYGELHARVVEAFRKEFVTSAGRLAVPTQTAHVLALMFDLVEEKDRKRTIDTLIAYLEESKYHLTTGFVGTPYLCHALSANGRADAAYKLLLQTDYPSWLYSITKGATTIWEHWDGIKEDGSFWSADMNSFNHYAYGSIGDWMYRVAAGIDTDDGRPGYKHVYIRPQPGGGLTHVKAQLETMYGMVISHWEQVDNTIRYHITIPPNTSATVLIPTAKPESLVENGKPAAGAEGITACEQAAGGVSLEIGSGLYCFECSSVAL
jgi:alpha-L-rhamnosidase